MKKSVLKQIIREEVAKVRKQKSKNIVTENAVTDLLASIKTFGFKKAVLMNAGPPLGTSLYNGFKTGAAYKTKNKKGESIFSKEVSWYAPDKVPGLAKKLDAADTAYEQAFKNFLNVQEQLHKKLGAFKDRNTMQTTPAQGVSTSKEYLEAHIALLKAEKAKLLIQNEMEVAMGGKTRDEIMGMEVPMWGPDGSFLGVSKERADLAKVFPKKWVDDAFTDKPTPVNNRVESINGWISDIEKSLNTTGNTTQDSSKSAAAQTQITKSLKSMSDQELEKSLEAANKNRMDTNAHKQEKPQEADTAFLVYAEHKLEKLMRIRKNEKNPEQLFFTNTDALKKLGIKSTKDIQDYPNLQAKIGMSSEDLLKRYNKFVGDMYRADEELAGWQDEIREKADAYKEKYKTPYKSILK